VLAKHVPMLVADDQINQARSMTLKQIQQFAGAVLSHKVLADIDLDLSKLPVKK
jgi:hypothetical protein